MSALPLVVGEARVSREIAVLASQQCGLVTRAQLIEIGLTESAVDKRIVAATLHPVHPGVYSMPGVPKSWEQALLAALLGAGEPSFVSHLAAAVIWKLEDIGTDVPHILLPHERRVDLDGVVVHRTRVLDEDEVTRRSGLRLTSVARTLVDIAGLVPSGVRERALDDALRRRIVTLGQITECLERRGPNGVRGWGRMNRFVLERNGTEPTGSGKETTFLRALKRRGLPVPVTQFKIRDANGRFVARVDLAYPDLRLAIEIDGSHHFDLVRREGDLRRQNRIQLQNWRYLRFHKTDRVAQADALATIESAFAVFGEFDRRESPVELPKRQRSG